MTASASRRAGTALGDTKEVTSIRGTPVAESRSTTSTLTSVGIQSGSIWNPSRVPTSQSVTRCGSFMRCPSWASQSSCKISPIQTSCHCPSTRTWRRYVPHCR